MKKMAIVQSNYIPWKGYFDFIAYVDEFVLYDDVQYTKGDWRNRNQIKTPHGIQWLSLPIITKGKLTQRISEAMICQKKDVFKLHWKTICQNYQKAPFFKEIEELIYPIYEKKHEYLSELNDELIKKICAYIGIQTKITKSSDYELTGDKTERVLNICLQGKANEYVSGKAAESYFDENLANKKNIKITWFDYENYPEYKQLWGNFAHDVSIIDLLFNCGPESKKYMRYVK